MGKVKSSRGKALVTGASRGIGRAVTAALAEDGWEVIGTCREPRALVARERIRGVRYLPLDQSRDASVAALLRSVRTVDVLVLNAGESPIGPAEEAPIERVREHFQVNFFAPVRLLQALLPGMRSRGKGMVVVVGSIRSEAPTPFSAMYSASKAALRAFADSLRMEVTAAGVRVAVLAPWASRTTFPQQVVMRRGSPYTAAVKRVKARRDAILAAAPEPRVVARAVLDLLSRRHPPALTLVGRPVFSLLLRHLPRGLVERLSARMVGMRK